MPIKILVRLVPMATRPRLVGSALPVLMATTMTLVLLASHVLHVMSLVPLVQEVPQLSTVLIAPTAMAL